MSSSRLILAAACVFALSVPACAQVAPSPAPDAGRVLTQEYARLYREFLDKKKLGLDADAAAKYAEFLAAFRKHRLISRLGLNGGGDGGGSPGGADTGGVGGSTQREGGGPASLQSPPVAPPPADNGGGITNAP